MPVSIGGVASGMDTDAIITKLMEVEARPIKKLQYEIAESNDRKKALGFLNDSLKELSDSARDLYGFRASYDEKKAISSDTSVLEVTASKLADPGIRKVEVVKLASTHKITTDQIEEDRKLKAGKIVLKVNGEEHSIKFKGGKITSLKDRIDEVAGESVSTSVIRIGGDKFVLSIESKVQGVKGKIGVEGDLGFLREIGLASGEKITDQKTAGLIFDRRYFSPYAGSVAGEGQDGSLAVSEDGKSVTIDGMLWQEYALPVQADVKKDTVLAFDFKRPVEEKKDEPVPSRVIMGPDERIVVKGIELKGYNVSRIREEEKKPPEKEYDSAAGVGVVYTDEAGVRNEKRYIIDEKAEGRQQMPIGADFEGRKISRVFFYSNKGKSVFSNAAISTPVKDDKTYEIKNQIAPAEDAVVKLDGIEIKRDRNSDLNDIIKGVTMNLRQASERPVDVKIEADAEKSIDKIKKFVEAYNKYIDLNRQLVKTEEVSKPGESKSQGNSERGIFSSDMSVIRIESTVKRIVNGAYPNSADRQIKILPQIGVSTGKVNAAWETIKTGKLVVDEAELKKVIVENPEGVKLFFGSDTDADTRIDSGMAYALEEMLKAYVGFGRNVISSKIDLENENIRISNERIARHEDHLKKHEAKLRAKFGAMERAISGANSQKNWMNQQMGNSGGNSK